MSGAGATWLDLSLPIGPDSVAWAGLARPRLSHVPHIDAGDPVTVGQLDCCLHTGTHADAPRHVLAGGFGAEGLDVGAFLGPALVLCMADPDVISLAELVALGVEAARPERLLVATPRQYDGRAFPDQAPHLEPAAAEYLAGLGVRLVGVNVPSMDPLDSRDMVAHKVLFAGGVAILENLRLEGLRPGPYELVAPPLAVVGGDAAPVRALARWLG